MKQFLKHLRFQGSVWYNAHGSKTAHTLNSTKNPDSAIPFKDVAEKINEICGDIPVQLMSCWDGTGEEASQAQVLADLLGRPVSGYDGYVQYSPGLPLGLAKPIVRPLGNTKNITRKPSN